MRASAGDWLITESARDTSARRRGQIVEVHGTDGGPPYLVRWADNNEHESLVFPGPDSHVVNQDEMDRREAVHAFPGTSTDTPAGS